MKKALMFIMALCIIITAIPVFNASALVQDGMVYSIKNNEAWLTSGDNATGNVAIPATVQGYPVTHIDETAFWCNSDIKKIIFSNNNITIGKHAFANCDGLTKIVFGNGKTVIEEGGFATCVSVTEIDFNEGEVIIGPTAFIGCNSLEELKIGPGVKSIGEDAFDLCNFFEVIVDAKNPYFSSDRNGILYNKNKTELIICPIWHVEENYKLPISVTSIARKAFANCTYIETVSLHSKVEKIDPTAFMDCYNLKKITVDAQNPYFSSDSTGVLYNKNKTELLKYPEANLSARYKIPAGTVKIADYAFYQCEYLNEVTFQSGLQSIGNEAFFSCSELAKALLPDTVECIGEYAFANCSKMTDFTFGKKIQQISNGIFQYCYALKSIEIPETVTSIGNSAFFCCSALTGIVIPENVTTVGEWAFSDCIKLESVKIPVSVKTIGNYAFRDCTALKTVYFNGIQEQWDFIQIGYGNSPLLSAELICKASLTSNRVLIYASEGDIAPQQTFTADFVANPTMDFELMKYFNSQNACVYNLELEKADPNAKEYTVFMPLPDGMQMLKAKILQLDESDSAKIVPSTVKNGYCCFKTRSLGNFAIVEKNGQLLSGDFDDDFEVSLQDVVYLARICADWDVEYNENNLDVNGDGSENLQDVVHLSQFVAGWSDIVIK